MIEKWKYIPNYKGYYSASNLGNIRRDNSLTNTKSGNILKSYKNKFGYHYLSLCKKGKKSVKTVHSLVAESFLGNRKGRQVNHKDGNKSNNGLNNLEYVTSKKIMNTQVELV